jgi:GMP reductase
MKIIREHSYSSVYMVPKKCIAKSRADCNIDIMLGPLKFRNPIIPADMPSVVNFETCEAFAKMGMFYVMHRFGITDNELIEFCKKMNATYGWSSISIGIKSADRELLNTLYVNKAFPTYINIDVAHAYSDECTDLISFIKDIYPEVFLIVGNVATLEAVNVLYDAGADAVRIFISPGSGCSTKDATGFLRASIEFIDECYLGSDCPIIADGGITCPGDVAKAIGAGAYMVMAGGVLAGHNESPGSKIKIDGKDKFCYYGNASFNNKKEKKHIEGKDYFIDPRGPLIDTIKRYEDGLRSAVSYAGVNNIKNMCGTAEFKEIV